MALALLLGFLTLIVLGVPVSFAMGCVTIAGFLGTGGSMMIIAQKLFSGVDNFTYLCIPLYVLASEIMASGRLTEKIVHFCDNLVGHVTGGLAHVNVMASMLFAGISGSATADASGLGRIEIDIMDKAGYPRDYAGAVTAASAIIGPIIPPSGIMIIYAVV
ncbi:MAG: TRAP transporter large permease subunit, partial [Planctomycetota bacterium]|nr:TRAP transporter large permease subunit [Planctomycetota bacterium]